MLPDSPLQLLSLSTLTSSTCPLTPPSRWFCSRFFLSCVDGFAVPGVAAVPRRLTRGSRSLATHAQTQETRPATQPAAGSQPAHADRRPATSGPRATQRQFQYQVLARAGDGRRSLSLMDYSARVSLLAVAPCRRGSRTNT